MKMKPHIRVDEINYGQTYDNVDDHESISNDELQEVYGDQSENLNISSWSLPSRRLHRLYECAKLASRNMQIVVYLVVN